MRNKTVGKKVDYFKEYTNTWDDNIEIEKYIKKNVVHVCRVVNMDMWEPAQYENFISNIYHKVIPILKIAFFSFLCTIYLEKNTQKTKTICNTICNTMYDMIKCTTFQSKVIPI